MEFKIAEVLDLNRTINELADMKLNTILAYKIARIRKKLQEEVTTIEENRTQLIMPYIKKDENNEPIIDNGIYEVIEETRKELTDKLNEFFGTEIKIELPTLQLKELESIELTPKQIEALMKIIEE